MPLPGPSGVIKHGVLDNLKAGFSVATFDYRMVYYGGLYIMYNGLCYNMLQLQLLKS